MAPVATSEKTNGTTNGAAAHGPTKVFNPFYSPPAPEDNEKDKDYKYAHYKACLDIFSLADRADRMSSIAAVPRREMGSS